MTLLQLHDLQAIFKSIHLKLELKGELHYVNLVLLDHGLQLLEDFQKVFGLWIVQDGVKFIFVVFYDFAYVLAKVVDDTLTLRNTAVITEGFDFAVLPRGRHGLRIGRLLFAVLLPEVYPVEH